MPDLVETGSDISLQHPMILTWCGREVVDLGDRVMLTPLRTEPVRAWQEIRLENWFEHLFQRSLDHSVCDGRDTQLPQFPGRPLRNRHPSHFNRPVGAGFQRLPDAVQKRHHPDMGLDPGHCGPVDTSCSCPGVRRHAFPRISQERPVVDEVEQIVEPAGSMCSRPTMHFGLHPPYRVICRTLVRPLRGVGIHQRIFGHYSPSATAMLPPFPMYVPLARSEYYDGSVPPESSADVAPIPTPSLWPKVDCGTITGGSHVHCCSIDELGTRLYPCGIATATP